MKPIALLLFTMLLLSSCITPERCNRRFPPSESVIIKDSIITRTQTVFKDSLVPFFLPPDTVVVVSHEFITDPQDPSLINIDTIDAENDFSLALAWVYRSQLGLSLIQKDSTLHFLLDSAVRETSHYRDLYHKELRKEVKTVRYIPKFYRFCSYWFFITFTALLVYAFFKLKKFLPF